jgi:uncharacterized protein YjiS (DUF1127 family)
MTDLIHLRPGAAGPARRDLAPTAPRDRSAGRLLGAVADAIRRGLAVRELRRLDDRLLRDIGLDRRDLAGGAGPFRATVAWDAGNGAGSHLFGAPDP